MPHALVYRHLREASHHVGFPEEFSPTMLSCRHLLACIPLGWAPFCPVLLIISRSYHPAHFLVIPAHQFLTQLFVVDSSPIIPSSKLSSQAGQPVGHCPTTSGYHLFLAVLDHQSGSNGCIIPTAMQSLMSGMLQFFPACCGAGNKTLER